MECVCGREMQLMNQNITTTFNKKQITILEVPVYICEVDHIKLSRETRKRMRFDLKHAHDTGLTEWHFGS